jgi:beta-N-acetylhexosaminidase
VDGDIADALIPFRAAIAADVRAIMTAHVRFPALDDAPATLSRAILEDLLRGELGFAGTVVTDALEMRAVSGTVGIEEGAVRALEAGADTLCLGAAVDDELVTRVHGAIVERVDEERLRAAAARVAELAEWARPSAGGEVRSRLGIEAARRALELHGTVRLPRAALVVDLSSEPSIAAGPARHSLAAVLGTETASLPVEANDRQLVVVLRDAHRHPQQRAAVESLLEVGDAVVVETGVPLWRPRGAQGLFDGLPCELSSQTSQG